MVFALCRARGITLLDFDSFASSPGTRPPLQRETHRWARTEYLIELGADDLLSRASQSHRQRIRLGAKSGLQLKRTRETSQCITHLELIGSSMTRRTGRSSGDGAAGELNSYRILLETGAGELFQARRLDDDACLASMLVLRAPKGGYDQSSGSTEEGKRLGASHFLVHAVASALEKEGATVLNLGGARASEEGLQGFKRRFGAREVELTSARCDLGGPLRRIAAKVVSRFAGGV
jgi:lipid II:glycine glycyltransferase (peptidoglycan interpeptide bridge formation enzyme)